MTNEEIVKQVKDIIVDKLGVEESEVTETASFTNDLGADSLDTVELLMEFEKVFGIKIPDEETSGIATVGDAIAKVPEKLAYSGFGPNTKNPALASRIFSFVILRLPKDLIPSVPRTSPGRSGPGGRRAAGPGWRPDSSPWRRGR